MHRNFPHKTALSPHKTGVYSGRELKIVANWKVALPVAVTGGFTVRPSALAVVVVTVV